MRSFIVALGLLLGFGSIAQAQDFGVILGVQESNATASAAGLSSANEFGFRIGGAVSVPLADEVNFRSGLIYTQRHFDLKDSTGNKFVNNFDYIDVPALVQYNFNENVGLFGGLIVAFNTSNSISASGPTATSATATGVKSMLPLFQIGINGTFNNQFGIEAYYEMGSGDIYDGAKNYSVFGANFIYWL